MKQHTVPTDFGDMTVTEYDHFQKPVLKPCPFCGGESHITESYDGLDETDDIWLISCEQCPAEMRGTRQTCERLKDMIPDERATLIAEWNTRLAPNG